MQEQTEFFVAIGRKTGLGYSVLILVGSMALFASLPAIGGVATGSMELACTPPIGLEIRLPGPSENGALLLHLFATPTKVLTANKPLSATATKCTDRDKCENAQGTVEFSHLNLDKKATGTYTIEFSDGHEEEGAFSVARRQQKKPFLCE